MGHGKINPRWFIINVKLVYIFCLQFLSSQSQETVIENLSENILSFSTPTCLIHLINYQGIDFRPFHLPVVLSRYVLDYKSVVPTFFPIEIVAGRSQYKWRAKKKLSSSMIIDLSLKARWTCLLQYYLFFPIVLQPHILDLKDPYESAYFPPPATFKDFWGYKEKSIRHVSLDTQASEQLISSRVTFTILVSTQTNEVATWNAWNRGINNLLYNNPHNFVLHLTVDKLRPNSDNLGIAGSIYILCQMCLKHKRSKELVNFSEENGNLRAQIITYAEKLNSFAKASLPVHFEQATTDVSFQDLWDHKSVKSFQNNLQHRNHLDNNQWYVNQDLGSILFPNSTYVSLPINDARLWCGTSSSSVYGKRKNAVDTCERYFIADADMKYFGLQTEQLVHCTAFLTQNLQNGLHFTKELPIPFPSRTEQFTFLSCGTRKVNFISFEGFTSAFDGFLWAGILFILCK
jgi:hypothetical protein